MLRGTDFSKYPAVRRFAFSLKHIATATGRIWFAFDRRHRIFFSGIKSFPFFPEHQAGSRDHTQSTPFGIAGFHQFLDQCLCLRASFAFYHARITVYKERLSLLETYQCNCQCGKQLLRCKSCHHTTDTFLCQMFTERRSCDGIDMARVKEHIRAAFNA